MVSQEIQSVSTLFLGRTGLIGKFPSAFPESISFVLEDGTPLHLLGFESCHPSVIPEMGQKRVACFGIGKAKRRVRKSEWACLLGSANAVLFTKYGRARVAEILQQVDCVPPAGNGVATFSFRRVGEPETFIPVAG